MKISSLFPSTSLEEALRKSSKLYVEEIAGAPKSLLLQALTRPLLIIAPSGAIEDWRHDLTFLLKSPPLILPAWDTLIGEEIPPNADLVGKRMQTLYELSQRSHPILLVEMGSALQYLPCLEPSDFLLWEKGAHCSWEEIPQKLTSLGYLPVPMVTDKKQFALRHGIVDIFPISSPEPYRIEFFGDTIDTLRTFDLASQRSIEKKERVLLAPTDEKKQLQKKGKKPLWELFQKPPLIVLDDPASLEDAFVTLKSLPGYASPWMMGADTLFQGIAKYDLLYLLPQALERLSPISPQREYTQFSLFDETLFAQRYAHNFYPASLEMIEEEAELPLYFFYEKENQKKEILSWLETHHISSYTLLQGDLSSSFLYEGKFFFSGNALTQKKRVSTEKWRAVHHGSISDFHNLEVGDFVVHFHSGIGRYLGIEKQKNHLGVQAEFLVLEYAKKSTLYMPISQAHLLSRYIGSTEKSPVLTELGSKKWHQAKLKAQKEILGYAADLLHLYAERQLDQAPPHTEDSDLMRAFEEDFPYEETPDQKRAIEEIKQDLRGGRPMDRLIAGDVGYGKTEVAIRAAFKSVVDGQGQVALLVPTTVLAMQHYETFLERMHGYPITVRVLSRFHTRKETAKILEEVRLGKVDILIGTHRLLSQDVTFSSLTLLIIDEEQRFGVRAKEALKVRKKSVHCLALSATPIPRTLYMSLVGARDISTIATPPQNRLPIKTILAETDDTLIKNALLREIARQGQVFYIHNRVESITARAAYLKSLVPGITVGIAHGQMDTHLVDEVFHDFRMGKITVLLATVIVENGIDIPNANTILIDGAHRYGISDLYQLRGRVGRGERSSYAYFLLPKNRSLQESSEKRLQALLETSGYGGGMRLAMLDLELRGAGHILGTQQSGQVASVGFHLYCKLLQKALRSLRENKPVSFAETKLEFSFAASLPEYYIPEKTLRMELYQRLGEASTEKEIAAFSEELVDRFGPLPNEAHSLLELTKIRLFGAEHQFTKLRFFDGYLVAERTLGKKQFTKNIPLPDHTTAKGLQGYVCEALREEFLTKKPRAFRFSS